MEPNKGGSECWRFHSMYLHSIKKSPISLQQNPYIKHCLCYSAVNQSAVRKGEITTHYNV